MGHSYHIAIFNLPEDVEAPHLVIHTFVDHPEELCAATMAHLHDAAHTPNENYMW
jgi:hypothetical protein